MTDFTRSRLATNLKHISDALDGVDEMPGVESELSSYELRKLKDAALWIDELARRTAHDPAESATLSPATKRGGA